MRAARRDIDDAPSGAHPRCCSLNGEEWSTRIHGHVPIKFLFCHIGQRGSLSNSRVVDQNVQPAELFDGIVHEPPYVHNHAHIRRQSDGSTSGTLNRRNNLGRLSRARAVIHHYRSTFVGQTFRDGSPDPSRRTRHDRHFPRERLFHFSDLPAIHPCGQGTIWIVSRAYAKACFKSAIRSSASSRPTETLTVPGLTSA